MKRVWFSLRNQIRTMANIPPRKNSPTSKPSKQDASPLQILLQMGFPRHRALKALAATGNRSVQLASDWLLTHVNDTYIDADEPREYILYANPTGALLTQLHDFWAKSKKLGGWNGAHNFPPHITLISFFKAPDETSLQLAKAVKTVIETVGDPPGCPLKLDPYISQNFMGLFVSEEHAEYLKKIAVQYVKQVSSLSINLEAHVKSLHITLAYHFEVAAFDGLKALVDELQPLETSSWELRLYSRDPKFANHQVHKVTQGYSPLASDELELVLGDYIYIEEKAFDSSPDGWVPGTSWLTGVSGYLPAVFTRRTAESDAWTLHRAISLGNNSGSDCKSESDSNTDGEMAGYPHEDATQLGHDKSEEVYKEWQKYWEVVMTEHKSDSIVNVTQGTSIDWKSNSQGTGEGEAKAKPDRRWFFTMRHGERVDLTYGSWVPFCFDEAGNYVRKDLNMPLTLGDRVGGSGSYSKDTPLTRVGRLQASLVGEGLRLAQQPISHVYASAALRCVETAHCMLEGYQNPSLKVKVEPGLFEFKNWYLSKGGMAPFMTPQELHKTGLNVDLTYTPYIDLDITTSETLEEFYKRNELVMHSAVKDTEEKGGNIMFIGHAATLDIMVLALKRLAAGGEHEHEHEREHEPYTLHPHLLRVPYCALGAMRDRPWQVVSPPCPPSINSSSGRFDWRILQDL
ncbi:protein UBASH3A homolog isoform X2 [Leguminivora glycinivorella]|uniref:protein UBASH3A homolog isoform X2 n=1 Tax=Leguminivora glycinivorella TaxID=1035111 RepID=UPI00200D487E|nr:protein UBASH3A homolog isoform X2 [Leguminivora glycinivorella]